MPMNPGDPIELLNEQMPIAEVDEGTIEDMDCDCCQIMVGNKAVYVPNTDLANTFQEVN
ncbi:MAG: hypothetical protein QOE62_493 [Actinomycetota bacterium]|nr:hypothetical protein [Actinomycetota bacterium]